MSNRASILEQSVICATAGLSGLVAILDLLGLLDAVPWLREHIVTLTLLLVSSLTTFMVISVSKRLRTIDYSLFSLLQKLALEILIELIPRIDPSIEKVLGDYIRSLLVTLQRAFTERVVVFHDVDLFCHFWKRTLTSLPRATLLHTSLPYRRYFWKDRTTDEAILAFIKKGGKMQRIFFLNGMQELSNEEVHSILSTQCDLGVEVYITDANTIPSHLYKLISADTKKRIGSQVFVGAMSEIVKTEVTSDPAMIEGYIRTFKDLLELDGTKRYTG